MNPAFYRTGSSPHAGVPGQSGSRGPAQGEHAGAQVPVPFPMGMALPFGYPSYAAAAHAQAEAIQRLQQGQQFGLLHPGHFYPGPGASPSPHSYHISQDGTLMAMPPARSVSPQARRSTAEREQRDRYLRTISPNESRSPGVMQMGKMIPQHHQYTRPASPPRVRDARDAGYNHDARGPYSTPVPVTLPKKARAEEMAPAYHRPSPAAEYLRPAPSPVVVKHELRQTDYAPRLEAISPPSDENTEMDKKCQQVEAEIRVLENNVKNCDKNVDQWEAELKAVEGKKEDYERVRKSQAETARPSSPESDVTGDMLRRIVAENRRIAESEHAQAGKRFSITVTASVNNHHPSSLVDAMLSSSYQKQRAGIILRLKKDRQAKQIRERYLKERYKQLSQAYVSRLEKAENNPKKRTREAKMREYYERQFPEIRKNREDKLRDLRLNRAKGEPEIDLSNLDENDMEKYYRNAVLVPMLLDAKDRSRHFYDRNRVVDNPARDYKESVSNCFWTQEEKDIFKDKYLQRPKDFGYISSFLKRKTTQDCIQYYYLTKRKENYKQMVKKQKAFRMRRGPNKRLQSLEEPVTPSKMSLNTSLVLSNSIMDVEDNIQAITLTILCPARKCQAGRRAIKRLFKTPSEFPNFGVSARRIELPDTATSCCKYCIYYIEKRLGLNKWSEGEVETLKKALASHGTNWALVSKTVATKRVRDCVQYYRANAVQLGMALTPPDLLAPHDDEFSPWTASSTSSDDEEPLGVEKAAEGGAARSDAFPRIRSDSVDSNATLSADEGDTEEDVENIPRAPPHQYLSTLPRSSVAHSFSPSQLPIPNPSVIEKRRSPMQGGGVPLGMAIGGNGPACVRDLIHSAIEKNLDKDRPTTFNQAEFRRKLENDALSIHAKDRRNQNDTEVAVAVLARNSANQVDSDTRMAPHLLIPRGQPSRESARSPVNSRRDLSSPAEMAEASRRPQAYQYSTRQNLLTDFVTSRQLHAEQSAEGKSRSNSQQQQQPYTTASYEHPHSQPHVTQADPRFVQLYSPYVAYLPPGSMYNMITPEYMEQLASVGFPPVGIGAAGMMPALMGQQQNQQQRPMAVPTQHAQRSIILGTGRPGLVGDESGQGGERDNLNRDRLQTLAANRGLLRESEKRKPEVITIDENRRDGGSPVSSGSDMKFYPAPAHHFPKGAESGGPTKNREPNPNLTAGSLIDVIITRQIGSQGRPGGAPGPEQNAANSLSVVAGGNAHLQHPMSSAQMSRKRRDEEAMASQHRPVTLGEHIEQIIASDFSRKDTPSAPSLEGMGPRPMGVASPLNPHPLSVSPLPMHLTGMMPVVSLYQSYGGPAPATWKRRLRMDEGGESPPPPPAGPSKPVVNTVEYEPISPAEKEPSDEEDERS